MDLIGYARVSTSDQDHALQADALAAAGCARTFTEKASGSLDSRPELARCVDHLRPGDTLVVWRLDRLGRSVRHLTDTVTTLAGRGAAGGRQRAGSRVGWLMRGRHGEGVGDAAGG